jgi:mRNA interferase RelE/StbE
MKIFPVLFSRSSRKDLESLDARLVEKIFPKIEALSQNPRPMGCKKLKGSLGLWRIRIGDYRVVYSVSEEPRLIEIMVIRHRRDVYRS